jgi:hypothetical protein
MKTFSNVLDSNNKKKFNAEIEITLENNIIMKSNIEILESIEIFAKETIIKSLNEKNLNYKIIKIEEVE